MKKVFVLLFSLLSTASFAVEQDIGLSDELWVNIIRRLPTKDILNTSKVCEKFHMLAFDANVLSTEKHFIDLKHTPIGKNPWWDAPKTILPAFADAGNASAQRVLVFGLFDGEFGDIYGKHDQEGNYKPFDKAQQQEIGKHLLKVYAEKGNQDLQGTHFYSVLSGVNGYDRDVTEAARLSIEYAARGNSEAFDKQKTIFYSTLHGNSAFNNLEANPEEATKIALMFADAGNAEIQKIVIEGYRNGKNGFTRHMGNYASAVRKYDPTTAAKWDKKRAALLGKTKSQNNDGAK